MKPKDPDLGLEELHMSEQRDDDYQSFMNDWAEYADSNMEPAHEKTKLPTDLVPSD